MSDNAAQIEARVDAIVGQIAYAQAHGCRAVLDEALAVERGVDPAVRARLEDARTLVVEAERLLRLVSEVTKGTDEDAPAPFVAVGLVTVTA